MSPCGAYILAGVLRDGDQRLPTAPKGGQTSSSRGVPPRDGCLLDHCRGRRGALARRSWSTEEPAKLAAMESHWETTARAPLLLVASGRDQRAEQLRPGLSIPGGLSLLRRRTTQRAGERAQGHPAGGPPARAHVAAHVPRHGLLGLFLRPLALGLFFWRRRIEEKLVAQAAALLSIPLPYLATDRGLDPGRSGAAALDSLRGDEDRDAISPIDLGRSGDPGGLRPRLRVARAGRLVPDGELHPRGPGPPKAATLVKAD